MRDLYRAPHLKSPFLLSSHSHLKFNVIFNHLNECIETILEFLNQILKQFRTNINFIQIEISNLRIDERFAMIVVVKQLLHQITFSSRTHFHPTNLKFYGFTQRSILSFCFAYIAV